MESSRAVTHSLLCYLALFGYQVCDLNHWKVTAQTGSQYISADHNQTARAALLKEYYDSRKLRIDFSSSYQVVCEAGHTFLWGELREMVYSGVLGRKAINIFRSISSQEIITIKTRFT